MRRLFKKLCLNACFFIRFFKPGDLILLKTSSSFPILKKKIISAKLPNNATLFLRVGTNDIWILKEIYVNEAYEKTYKPKLNDIVFDVGSHIGIFSIKTSQLVGKKGIIFSFEPEPHNFLLLFKNKKINNADNIKIFRNAVSSKNKIEKLNLHPFNTGMHSLNIKKKREKNTLVSCITLDSFIKKNKIKNINLLKIDVEGHELEVLRGATEFLKKCENILLETHEKEGGPPNKQILSFLFDCGFTSRIIKHSKENDIVYAFKNRSLV